MAFMQSINPSALRAVPRSAADNKPHFVYLLEHCRGMLSGSPVDSLRALTRIAKSVVAHQPPHATISVRIAQPGEIAGHMYLRTRHGLRVVAPANLPDAVSDAWARALMGAK